MGDLRKEVVLPSRGKPYPGDEVAFVSPMTAREEKLLAGLTKASQFNDVIDEIVTRCLTYGTSVKELLSADWLYLLFKIRENSYGDDYGFKVTCPRCGEEYGKTIKLSEIPVRYLEEDWKEPFGDVLPISKKVVKLRL